MGSRLAKVDLSAKLSKKKALARLKAAQLRLLHHLSHDSRRRLAAAEV